MPSSRLNKPIALTIGDPAGVGPEVTLKALKSLSLNKRRRLVVIGDRSCLIKIAKKIHSHLPPNLIDLKNIKRFDYGRHQASCGKAAVQYIDKAVELLKKGVVKALVTAPVNKDSINRAGVKFSGHTEYLAGKAGVRSPVMMFMGGRFKVVLVTRHLPLSKVADSISEKKIMETAMSADRFLKRFLNIKRPRIGIAGLNPHAGEEGLLGQEERDIIAPAINKLKRKIPRVSGPLPADSAFHDLYNRKYDILVCMYHDQCMIPVKMLARNHAVNVTLGLPYIRTSPVHGTAFDIAGKGKADPSSMVEALNLACQLLDRC